MPGTSTARSKRTVSDWAAPRGRGASARDIGSSIRYLGSKARVAGEILRIVGPPPNPGSSFVDAFAGTGIVGREAAMQGWSVRLNDHLLCSSIMAAGVLVSSSEAAFDLFGGYAAAVRILNSSTPEQGFLWREYSPASAAFAPVTRTYFTEENAAFIDGARKLIARWSAAGLLTSAEERLLIADLLAAASRVANTAGTFGCFLREWMPNALQPAKLVTRDLLSHTGRVEVLNTDVHKVPMGPSDVAYFDPPYTKRQYAAYYHVLETIAHGDEPVVDGVTGLRPWRAKASDFCYRSRALTSIKRLVDGCSAQRILLSYSSEGHVDLDSLRVALAGLGDLKVHALGEIGRYAPNTEARRAGSTVSEYLLELNKPEGRLEQAA
ncbi:MAG TPA: DNA adenine methylase [Longimicrobium sp.]